MVEEPLKMKKKDQVIFDEQEAIRLQAQFDEEERIAREKEEANAALIVQWNGIQDKVETDYKLAQRLQAEEQEELTIKEKSKLFQQLLEKRRKHFAAKRAEERRNKTPTKAQQRNIDTELVEGSEIREEESSSKRAGDELEQEPTKKKKVDDDKVREDLQQCFELVTEEDVAIDVIPLATKPAVIVDYKIHRKGKQGDIWKLCGSWLKLSMGIQGQENDMKECYGGRIVEIKRLLDDLEVTAAKVRVTAIKHNLVLLINFDETYAK
ncbi:hypothetical protein Tco_0614805 [Tanacetum coccineum]